MAKKFTDNFTIRFAMTKGEGDFPKAKDFSETEKENLSECISLNLVYDPNVLKKNSDAKITRIEFLYDGISHYDDHDFGYRFFEGSFIGYPAPIIKFTLDKKLETKDFIKAIWTSYISIKTNAMDDAFYAEDHNGYIQALTADQIKFVHDDLHRNGFINVKDPLNINLVLEFKDGLPINGYEIPGITFIKKR